MKETNNLYKREISEGYDSPSENNRKDTSILKNKDNVDYIIKDLKK
jgi:hypothetical protein